MTFRPPGDGQPPQLPANWSEVEALRKELLAKDRELGELRARFERLQHDVRRAWAISRGELKADGAPRPRRRG
jgi:hypothetical protein